MLCVLQVIIYKFQYFLLSSFQSRYYLRSKIIKKLEIMQSNSRIQPKQLIDQHKNFNRIAFESLREALPNVEKQYQSVAIIGVQNSGKSTLLNNLFGTNFEVLQKSAGERTTMGIWLSLDKESNIIVMDVEGNDAEKRANQQEYEKMVSTFALVEADTLIINVWSKTLGQYTGSQYQTLNAVLEICISQFKQESPKTLLFCVRDFNDEEDEEGEIRRKITKDVNNIWQKMQKPTEIAKYQDLPDKFFAVEVAVLRAFKKANPKNFIEDVKKLRERFINPKADGYVFKSKKHSHNLPLQDLPQLAENSWNSIITNKKLNLPNEKEQLSNFRCSEILNEQLNKFKTQMDKIEKEKSTADFGNILNHYLKEFEIKTYNYGKHIVEEKQSILKQEITDTIKRVIHNYLNFEEKKLQEQFRTNSTYINPTTSKTLEGKLINLKNQAIEKYTQFFKTLNFEVEERKERIQKLNSFIHKESGQILTKTKETINAEFDKQNSRQMRLLSSELMKKYFGKDFWTNVEKQYFVKRNRLVENYEEQVIWAENRVLQPNEVDAIDEKMSTQLRNVIREEFKKSLMGRVFDMFLKEFTKNKEGTPYNFNILDIKKITELYDDARDHAREIVSLINLYNIRRSKKSTFLEFEEEEKDEFFESTWLSNSLNDLDKKMIHEHETIIRRKKQNEMRQVPFWLIGIIVYFVYDDLWFPSETHPITNFVLTIFLVFVAFFFSIGQHKAFMQLWNLALQIGKNAVDMAKKKFQKS